MTCKKLNAKQTINKRITFFRPGSNAEIIILVGTDSVKMTLRKGNGITVLQGFHRMYGYRGGWNYYLWAFMCDLSSLSMIVFAITGFYLFYRTEKTDLIGWVIFASFSAFTEFILIYLMFLS